MIRVQGIGHTVKSGSDGDYWRLLAPGTYMVEASAPNYQSSSAKIHIRSAHSAAVVHNFTLALLDQYSTDPVFASLTSVQERSVSAASSELTVERLRNPTSAVQNQRQTELLTTGSASAKLKPVYITAVTESTRPAAAVPVATEPVSTTSAADTDIASMFVATKHATTTHVALTPATSARSAATPAMATTHSPIELVTITSATEPTSSTTIPVSAGDIAQSPFPSSAKTTTDFLLTSASGMYSQFCLRSKSGDPLKVCLLTEVM